MCVRPEYPTPQFERSNWINLNGEWDFKIDNEKCGEPKEYFNLDKFDEKIIGDGKRVSEGFEYNSGTNEQWLDVESLRAELKELDY